MNDVPYHIANEIILNAGDMSGNLESTHWSINESVIEGIMCYWTGTAPVGVLSVSVSNDDVNYAVAGTLPVSGDSGAQSFNLQELGFGWIKVNYTATSGVGSLTISINTKSL
jgi:hypothetical protein